MAMGMSASSLSSSSAIKQAGGENIKQFDISRDAAENLLEVRQDDTGKLINQESTARPEHRMGFANDGISQSMRKRFEGNARDHIIGVWIAQAREHRIDFSRRL